MKNFIYISTFFLLSGCTVHPIVKLTNSQASQTYKVDIIDQRPISDRESEILSLLGTNCLYGIARLGDENIKPHRIKYLSNRLSSEKGEFFKNKKVIVKEFSIYRNNQAKLRGDLRMPGQTGIVINTIHRLECFANKKYKGGYEPTENPDGENIAVIKISILIDGKAIETRVIGFAKNTPAHFPASHDVWSSVIKKAMNNAVTNVIRQINKY